MQAGRRNGSGRKRGREGCEASERTSASLVSGVRLWVVQHYHSCLSGLSRPKTERGGGSATAKEIFWCRRAVPAVWHMGRYMRRGGCHSCHSPEKTSKFNIKSIGEVNKIATVPRSHPWLFRRRAVARGITRATGTRESTVPSAWKIDRNATLNTLDSSFQCRAAGGFAGFGRVRTLKKRAPSVFTHHFSWQRPGERLTFSTVGIFSGEQPDFARGRRNVRRLYRSTEYVNCFSLYPQSFIPVQFPCLEKIKNKK